MFKLDFDDSPREALLHGFIKGLSAPAVLFNSELAPPLPPITPIMPPQSTPSSAVRGDWATVGNDLKKVIDAHGSTAATQRACYPAG